MEDRGYSSFSESDVEKGAEEGANTRCKSLYNEWKCPAYYPYHSYQKNKAKSVSNLCNVHAVNKKECFYHCQF